MAVTRGIAAVLLLGGLAAACGSQTQASTSHSTKSCSGRDVVASSSGTTGTNDGTNPDGPGRRASTLAGITLKKLAGPPCMLNGVTVTVMANGHSLNVRYRGLANARPVVPLRAEGDLAISSVAWYASWCGQHEGLTFGLRWADGSVTPTIADAAAPPCDSNAGTTFVTAAWSVNPGTASG